MFENDDNEEEKENKDNEVRFCSECGARMNLRVKRVRPYFDLETGEKLNFHYSYWKCPNKKWFFDSHDKYNTEPYN